MVEWLDGIQVKLLEKEQAEAANTAESLRGQAAQARDALLEALQAAGTGLPVTAADCALGFLQLSTALSTPACHISNDGSWVHFRLQPSSGHRVVSGW